MSKVLAYITAYQDQSALLRCIESIQQQDYAVDKIVVIDNSSARLLSQEAADALGIIVWCYPENIGISGGLNKLIPWAHNQSCDFIWMFDQDSEPAPKCLSCLLEVYSELAVDYLVGIVAPVSIDPRTQYVIRSVQFVKDRFQEVKHEHAVSAYSCDAPITSGSLLNLQTFPTVPPPDKRLFIDAVDFDYGLRLKQSGYQNFVVPQAVLKHNFGDPIEVVTIFGQKRTFQEYSALRYYYMCRNCTYLELKFSRGLYKLTCVLWRLRFLGSRIIRLVIAAPDDKAQKIGACLRGTYHGFLGDLNHPF